MYLACCYKYGGAIEDTSTLAVENALGKADGSDSAKESDDTEIRSPIPSGARLATQMTRAENVAYGGGQAMTCFRIDSATLVPCGMFLSVERSCATTHVVER